MTLYPSSMATSRNSTSLRANAPEYPQPRPLSLRERGGPQAGVRVRWACNNQVDRALFSKTRYQHPHGPHAHRIGLQGTKPTRIAVDSVRCETARCRAGGEEEIPLRVQAEGDGYSLRRHLPEGRQPPGGRVYGEASVSGSSGLYRRAT